MRVFACALAIVALALGLGLYLARSRSRGPEAMAATPTAAAPAATGNETPESLVVPEPETALEMAPEPAESAPPPAVGAPEEYELRYAGKSLDELRQAQARVQSALGQALERTIDQLEARGRYEVHPDSGGKLEIKGTGEYVSKPGEWRSYRLMRDMPGGPEWHAYEVRVADFPDLAALWAESEWLKAKIGTE
jgi:hypothetical protein